MGDLIKKVVLAATVLGALASSLACGATLDRFLCEIAIQSANGEAVQSEAKLTAVRREQVIGGVSYQNPADDLTASLTLANGFQVELWAQYTFKRSAVAGAIWGLHSCMSGSVTNQSGVKSGWFCPNLYFPVSEKNGVPQFDGANGSVIAHDFELDGEKVHLSCRLAETI